MSNFIELHPVTESGSHRELINVERVFSVVDCGDCSALTVVHGKNAYIEVYVIETYEEVVEKLASAS